jgi:hypothetical protein
MLLVLAAFSIGLSVAGTGEEPEEVSGVPSFRGEQPSEYILTMDDFGVDENNDTSYDKLVLELKINITISGHYSIFADMLSSGIKESDQIIDPFLPGVYDLELSFSGSKIYESGHDGPYIINVIIYKDGVNITDFKYETSNYKYESFNPTPKKEDTEIASIKVVNNSVELETEVFTAIIYELSPMIEFYYSTDEGQTTRFKISYNRIIAFNDKNQDEKFQGSELRYYGDLVASNWNSKKILMENFNSFDFRVQSIVNLLDVTQTKIDATKLELSFHYASPKKYDELKAAQKFDVSIKILGDPLPGVTHFSLEHSLEDTMANHEFMEQTAENKISFFTFDGKEHGYYSWKDFVTIKTMPNGNSNKTVTYNMERTEEAALRNLYLNYPYSMDTTELFHDPVVGVNPENSPKKPGPKPVEIIGHELLIYIMVAIVAGVIMLGSIYRQRKGRE